MRVQLINVLLAAVIAQTMTPSDSATATATATSTPLYVITAYPTTTATASFSATSTPLFMMTAWPTTSPVNVTPTSTPLFFYTAYPTVDLLNGTAIAPTTTGTSSATIMGGIAVAMSGAGAIGFAINYLRKGGSVSGLAKMAYQNRGKISENLKKLPLDDLKKKLGDNLDLSKLEEYKKRSEELYNKLPESMRDKVKDKLNTDTLIEMVENPDKFKKTLEDDVLHEVKAHIPDGVPDKLKDVLIDMHKASQKKNDDVRLEVREKETTASTSIVVDGGYKITQKIDPNTIILKD